MRWAIVLIGMGILFAALVVIWQSGQERKLRADYEAAKDGYIKKRDAWWKSIHLSPNYFTPGQVEAFGKEMDKAAEELNRAADAAAMPRARTVEAGLTGLPSTLPSH